MISNAGTDWELSTATGIEPRSSSFTWRVCQNFYLVPEIFPERQGGILAGHEVVGRGQGVASASELRERVADGEFLKYEKVFFTKKGQTRPLFAFLVLFSHRMDK